MNSERNTMAETDCPVCGEQGRLATNYSLAWFKCTSCRETYEVNHATCAHSGCGAWVDHEASGLCHFHAAQQGIAPDEDRKPFYPDGGIFY